MHMITNNDSVCAHIHAHAWDGGILDYTYTCTCTRTLCFICFSCSEEVLSGGSSNVVTNGDVRVGERERAGEGEREEGEGEREREREGEREGEGEREREREREGEGERESEREGERERGGQRERDRRQSGDEVFTETASAQARQHSIMRTSGEKYT